MSLGGILTVVTIQLGVLFVPLGLGLAGLVSGGVAGLTSVTAWFVVGIPLSYGLVERQAFRAAQRQPQKLHLATYPPTRQLS